jgi:hypothetical protein
MCRLSYSVRVAAPQRTAKEMQPFNFMYFLYSHCVEYWHVSVADEGM